MKFCTVINCIDGRVQEPATNYLKDRFKADFVDTITEAGPNLVLGQQKPAHLLESIIYRIKISIEKHNSLGIAIAGHQDCAGNPSGKQTQIEDIKKAIIFIKTKFPKTPVIGLWIDKNQQAFPINSP